MCFPKFPSSILHEIGHIVSGILLGLKINKLQLNIAGISLEFKNYGKERKINNIIIDLAGPLINLISAIIGILYADIFKA